MNNEKNYLIDNDSSAITTDDTSVGLGYRALSYNLTGVNNIAIGPRTRSFESNRPKGNDMNNDKRANPLGIMIILAVVFWAGLAWVLL